MAKIKFGMMMTDARGKLGGQVFSKNRSGAYVRTKVTPVNPRTVFQQANRVLLGNLSQGWSSLTELQRNSWNSAVENWQKTNVFGDLQKPTGKNLFTGLNKVMLSQFPERPIMVSPPSKAEFSVFSLVESVFVVGTGTKSITLQGASVGATFQVRATPPLTPGTSYFTNQLRTIGGAFSVDGEGKLIITTAYNDRFGPAPLNYFIGIEVREVSVNGQLSAPLVLSQEILV